jgi:hypothetical protein
MKANVDLNYCTSLKHFDTGPVITNKHVVLGNSSVFVDSESSNDVVD